MAPDESGVSHGHGPVQPQEAALQSSGELTSTAMSKLAASSAWLSACNQLKL